MRRAFAPSPTIDEFSANVTGSEYAPLRPARP